MASIPGKQLHRVVGYSTDDSCAYMKIGGELVPLCPNPAPTLQDVGKVLVVGSDGRPTWGTAT